MTFRELLAATRDLPESEAEALVQKWMEDRTNELIRELILGYRRTAKILEGADGLPEDTALLQVLLHAVAKLEAESLLVDEISEMDG